MASLPRASGFTLIEVMVAMAVLLIGSMGVLSLESYGVALNQDARITARATDVAQDLIAQMQTWDYANDARLQNVDATNDGSLANPLYSDPSQAFDHEEAELEASAQGWNGVPSADAQAAGLTRNWNIAELDLDPNGALLGRRVAVIVQWDRNGVLHSLVATSFIANPQVTN
jgi:prepilin-type N-terminal cleavage/methylation domain-containing protein